jgi:hypothetical protein
MLYHQTLGPVCVASMTKYQALEISNQQPVRGTDEMTLTPRIECSADAPFTSLNDLEAKLTAAHSPQRVSISASGRLLTTAHVAPQTGDIHYQLEYVLEEKSVEIRAQVLSDVTPAMPIRFVLPVVSRPDEHVEHTGRQVRIQKLKGALTISTDAATGFEIIPNGRVFNLVPGLLCLPLAVPITPGHFISIRISAA